jgi:DNA-binding NarL/FixJ family response regulator
MVHRPKIAIIDPNTLAVLGLKQLLLNMMPIVTVDTFGTLAELEANDADGYAHYFVSLDIVLANRAYFAERRRKTIVLTLSLSDSTQPSEFHTLCINQPEPQLIRQLLVLEQHAHGQGQHLPPTPQVLQQKILSDREIEVMVLIVQGYINKQIADRLNIALSTVVTHRKNIMDKLGLRSVSALTIYAVTHNYVDINSI